jgi:hypothetical protein
LSRALGVSKTRIAASKIGCVYILNVEVYLAWDGWDADTVVGRQFICGLSVPNVLVVLEDDASVGE